MGKGSTPRPFSVTNEEYANRWDAIFGRDLKKEEEEKPEIRHVICDECETVSHCSKHGCIPKKDA